MNALNNAVFESQLDMSLKKPKKDNKDVKNLEKNSGSIKLNSTPMP